MKISVQILIAVTMTILLLTGCSPTMPPEKTGINYYNPTYAKNKDSQLKVRAGQMAPDFTLPATSGRDISLSRYRGDKNVVLSFVPAAWTPLCSKQWPGYNAVKDMFDEGQAVLLGITVDNIPSLYAWTQHMGGVWFEVLSDFWPHGKVADQYGVLRSDGVAERALFFINKEGVINSILVIGVNEEPDLEVCSKALKKLN